LGTFSFSGDSFVTYNLPGRPIFDPLTSLFFYGGIVLCIRHWRKPAYAFVLMWLAMGLLPSLILGEWTSTLHSKAAEAPIMVLPALGALEFGRFVVARFGPRWGRLLAAGSSVWLIVVAASTGYDYFVRWGESPDTRAAYFHNLVAISDYVDDGAYSGDVVLSSPFPDLPLDPFIAELRVRRGDVSLRWCDARRAVVFPDAVYSLMIVPPNTPLDPHLAERLGLQLLERVHLRPDDVDPTFDVFVWDPRAALDRFLIPSLEAVTGDGEPLGLPVSFGAVELLSYELFTPAVEPGGKITLLTLWRILDPDALGPVPAHDYGRAAVLFAHVLDATDGVIGQEDRLDAPAWDWRSGEAFVQLHRFQINADVLPGAYRLEVGIYSRENGVRLPVLVDGGVDDDHVFLQPVEVISP
jgi:hypothetical protein